MKAKILFILFFVFWCSWAYPATVTLYHRSDSHTINGLNKFKLLETNSSSGNNTTIREVTGEIFIDPPVDFTCTYKILSVDLRHADSSETNIASGNLASTSRNSESSGIQSAVWNCPETSMSPTDALKITIGLNWEVNGSTGSDSDIWISEQLGWSKLANTDWTFYRYTYMDFTHMPDPIEWIFYGTVYLAFGNDTYETKITGIQYELPAGGYATIF